MNYLTSVFVPLGRQAHQFAQTFAAQQSTPQKGKRVYLNTLAVYSVHSYLDWLEIDSNLTQSDSWHPAKRVIADVADLVLPSLGRLECRPILPDETEITLPLEATENRIGYVVVLLNERLDSGELLGFVLAQGQTHIYLSELRSLDTLIEHLHHLKTTTAPSLICLSQWLQGVITTGWQSLETLWSNEPLQFASAFRSDPLSTSDVVRQGKVLDLGVQLGECQVVLVVILMPMTEAQIDILLQLLPKGQAVLPPSLQLSLLDDNHQVIMTVQAREEDHCIQIAFEGTPRECFWVQVQLAAVGIVEAFMI